MTEETPSSSPGEVGPFLRALVLARKNLQLYPAGNPAVATALDAAITRLLDLTAQAPLVLAFRRDAVLIAGEVVADPDGRFGRFAEDLYRRAVGTLTFEAGATAAELGAVLATMNRPVDALLLTGGPAAQPAVLGLQAIRIEHGQDVEIVEADKRAGGLDTLLSKVDTLIETEALEKPDGLPRFFLGVEEGDPDRIAALQALLAAPERLTLLFQSFALRVRDPGDDGGMYVSQLLRIIEAAADIARDLEDEGARERMYHGLAEMVGGLGADLREPLVVDGLLPRVPLRGFEARILRLFPVPELANAFARSVVLNEGTAAMVEACFTGLELDEDRQELLGLLVHSQLEEAGVLTPELDRFFTDVAIGALPETTTAPVLGRDDMIVLLPPDSQLEESDVRWQAGEYRKIRRAARRESLKSEDMDMLPLLQDLIVIERRVGDYDLLVSHARQLLVRFLERGQYTQARELLRLLRREREARAGEFTPRQLQQLDRVIQSLTDTGLINRLLRVLDAATAGSTEARQLRDYLREQGKPLVLHLLQRLEVEQSRHIRLVMCHTLAQLVDGHTELLVERLNHDKWYVVRNVLGILGEMDSPDVASLAKQALTHEDQRVVREAMKILAKSRTPEAVEALVGALRAPDPQVQASAASWLGIMGEAGAVSGLRRLLEPDPYAGERTVMLTAIEALGRIGTAQAHATLEPLTVRGSWFGRRRRAPIRDAARAALAAPKVRR